MKFWRPRQDRGWGRRALTIPQSRRGLFLLGLLTIVLGGLALWSWFVFDGIPARESLARAAGTVDRVQSTRRTLRFALNGSPLLFNYSSKGGEVGLVHETLVREDRPVLEVVYDSREPFTPLFSDEKYYSIYELTANGEIIRSHADIGAEWATDQAYGLLLGIVLLTVGSLVTFFAWL